MHALAVVRPAHRWQRQGKVIECDGQAHPRVQELGERGTVAHRLDKSLADGRVRVGERGQGFGRVDDAAPVGWQPLQPEALSVPDEHRGCGAVDFEDEPWTRHYANDLFFSWRMSKATFTDPRRPAAAACSMASAARSSE